MKQGRTLRFAQKQIKPLWYWLALAAAVGVRLVIALCQRVYIDMYAGLDDMLMVNAARSIATGGWLGEYGAFAMAKNMGFSVWLALLHFLRVPVLLGNALLWVGACAFAARALRPMLPGNLARLCVFAFLTFQPVSYAAFNQRVYRDAVFPACCLLLFAGAVGFALRLREEGARGSVLSVLGAGLGLAGAWLLREDGSVLLLFAVCAFLLAALYAVLGAKERAGLSPGTAGMGQDRPGKNAKKKGKAASERLHEAALVDAKDASAERTNGNNSPVYKKKLAGRLRRALLALVPFCVLLAGILGFSAANYAHYGVFMVNDFTAGSFPDAYSAMVGVSRAESGFTGKTPVSREALEKMYREVPTVALLQERLEYQTLLNGFGDVESGEYGGSFYYALRAAAQQAGATPDAVAAQEYWGRMAAEIAGAVAEGRLQSAGANGSVVPRFDAGYLRGTVEETGYGALALLTFTDCGPEPVASLGEPEDVAETAAWLHAKTQEGFVEGTDEPYYNTLQRMVFAFCGFLTGLYALAVWPLLAFALVRVVLGGWLGVKRLFKKQGYGLGLLLSLLALGLLLSALARFVVAGYMEAAAFGIGTYIMYLASAAPALLLFVAVGVFLPVVGPEGGVPGRVLGRLKPFGRADAPVAPGRVGTCERPDAGGEGGSVTRADAGKGKPVRACESRDLRFAWVVCIGVILVILKLVLAGNQSILLNLDEAPLDDTLAVETAMSISEGDWLGEYGWKTLSKHSFFSLWLAALHVLRIPYLLGGQLLWAGACLAAVWALHPFLKKRWLGLGVFGLLLFLPSSTANAAPYGYITRVYRDNIFPALCVLAIAGMIGYALRYREKTARAVGWLLLAGPALAACWLTREDGWWLLPFAVAAAVTTAVFLLRDKDLALKIRLRRCACLLLPFGLLLGGILGWSGMNYTYYGRFIVSDFSSGEFADAYGAMTRIEHANWSPKVAVPRDVRDSLYGVSPGFAELEDYLESDFYLGRYADANGDYSSGSFYWALREAAAEAGWYQTPQRAQERFESLARVINDYCDSGQVAAGPRRSSVSPPIKAAYVGPVLAEMVSSLWYCATFQDSDPRPMLSIADTGLNAPVEAYLRQKALVSAVEGTDRPYISRGGEYAFRTLDNIRAVYAGVLPVTLVVALLGLVVGLVRMIGRVKKHRQNPDEAMAVVMGWGLLACVLLRVAMIAFVTVSSFSIGTYIMYLATVHPMLVLVAVVGSVLLVRFARNGRSGWRGLFRDESAEAATKSSLDRKKAAKKTAKRRPSAVGGA